MKKYILSALLLLLVVGLRAQAPKFDNAVSYNDYIVEQQLNVGHMINAFNEAMGNPENTLADMNVHLEALLATARKSVANTKSMGAYQGNTRLRDAAVALYAFYVEMINKEYREMMEIALKAEPTEADLVRLQEILTDVSEREKGLDEAYLSAQEEFATAHGFKLEPTDFEIEGADE